MTRVKRGSVARKRRHLVLKNMSGARGAHSKLFRTASQQNTKALKYAYTGRRLRKRVNRKQWITRLNSIIRLYGSNYSTFIHKSRVSEIKLNRKVLAQLAIYNQADFTSLVREIY